MPLDGMGWSDDLIVSKTMKINEKPKNARRQKKVAHRGINDNS